MILNEIVLNALKYAYILEEEHKRFFCKSFVEKRKEEADRLHIIFRDYGKGIPENILNFQDGKSLGFRIIRTLVEQRDGELNIRNDKGCVYDLFVEL
ncbi:MAG: ATP-binding protein [Spirochaetaceae bacterium]|jgi:two-component sensor histidine kinase|nr:ATP-binding protein [Spirochaetaceae bacterium]